MASDDFNRADNADLGANWTAQTGASAANITSNQARMNGGASSTAEYWAADAFNDDQYAQCTVVNELETQAGDDEDHGAGPAVRMAEGDPSKYAAILSGDSARDLQLIEFSAAGAITVLGSYTAGTPAVGDVVRIEAEGTTIRVLLNGVERISVTDATLTGGRVGFAGRLSNNQPAVEDWEGGNLVTNPTFYLSNPVIGGGSAGTLELTPPTASTSTTGWTVGTTVANRYSRQTYNSEVPAANFTSTAQPSGAPTGSAQDCWRLSTATSGQFSAGTWYSSVSVIAVSSGGIQDGRARFRVWRSANADGTSSTELTQGTMIGSLVTDLSTTVAQSSSASTFIAASNLTNEFLFLQVAWETL